MTANSSRQSAFIESNFPFTNRLRALSVCAAWLVTTSLALWHESPRILAAANSPAGVLSWLFAMDLDWSLALLVLLTLPLMILGCRFARRRLITKRAQRTALNESAGTGDSIATQLVVGVVLFLLSLLSSASIGFRTVAIDRVPGQANAPASLRFYQLPPAYHDEFSYLLQARTFLAGRLSWPAMTVEPDLFHQVHVLNRPTTASRYFPWTGLWMAPFEALEKPYFGHWLAGALACVFFHRCLFRLMGLRYAFVGGFLIAISPGLACFSNLLLAHHPTMLALSVFLWAMLRFMDHRRVRDIVVAGIGLSLAMLGRPMTAAGFALPFGVWLIGSLVHQCRNGTGRHGGIGQTALGSPIRILMGIGIPLLLGFVVLMIMNHAITGRWTKSAYQLYTETWTPRHRYGFDNTNVDPSLPESKVLQSYDNWAENLTIAKAGSNVAQRTLYSLRWTLGLAGLTFCIISATGSLFDSRDRRPLLLMCSVLTLHAVHVPYWYDGIMHWHYVFETAPLLIMLATFGIRAAFESLRSVAGTKSAAVWLTAIILASLIPNWFDADTSWGWSRVTTAFQEQTFSRKLFEYFKLLTTSDRIQHPALVLVDERGSNPQLSYIVNPPDLSGDVIVCRLPAEPAVVDELARAFPNHHCYVFEPNTFQLLPY